MVGWGNCSEARQLIVDAIARGKETVKKED